MGDAVELPTLRQTFKIKSLQSFKQDVTTIGSGDRAGMCLAQLQASKIVRTFVSAPGLLQTVSCCVCIIEKCRFYQGAQCCLCSPHFERARRGACVAWPASIIDQILQVGQSSIGASVPLWHLSRLRVQ